MSRAPEAMTQEALRTNMTSHYPIVLEREPNGTVSAYVVGLPRVFAAADSEREAGTAIRKALRAHVTSQIPFGGSGFFCRTSASLSLAASSTFAFLASRVAATSSLLPPLWPWSAAFLTWNAPRGPRCRGWPEANHCNRRQQGRSQRHAAPRNLWAALLRPVRKVFDRLADDLQFSDDGILAHSIGHEDFARMGLHIGGGS
jgi:predicted RNase H-like HicB family nuclease